MCLVLLGRDEALALELDKAIGLLDASMGMTDAVSTKADIGAAIAALMRIRPKLVPQMTSDVIPISERLGKGERAS